MRMLAASNHIKVNEILLKKINSHPGSDSSEEVPPDQYEVKTVVLADRNFEWAVRVGDMLSFMLNCQDVRWIPSVRVGICMYKYVN